MAHKKEFSNADRKLSGSELAEKFSIHPATVRLWRSRGLPHTKLNTRLFRYNYEEALQWTQEQLDKDGDGDTDVDSSKQT